MPRSPILILNDSDLHGSHFGCMRVMRVIRGNLAQRGFPDCESLLYGTDWKSDPAALAALDRAQVLVIKGEGTLHHGKRKALWLLEAGARAKKQGKRVALINALWQDNPADWAALVREFDEIWCRDTRSAGILQKQSGRPVNAIGDLSMLDRPEPEATEMRQGIWVGCSVYGSVTRSLAEFSDLLGEEAEFVPVTTRIKDVYPHLKGLRRTLRRLYVDRYERKFRKAHPKLKFCTDDANYLAGLRQRELLVSGRFHSICLSVVARTPFIAVSSNSWKIEQLVADLSLSPDRIQPVSNITPDLLKSRDWRLTQAEQDAITARIAAWRKGADDMFDAIAALASAS